MTQTSLRIPAELMDRLRNAAAEHQRSMRDVIQTALTSYLDRLEPPARDGHTPVRVWGRGPGPDALKEWTPGPDAQQPPPQHIPHGCWRRIIVCPDRLLDDLIAALECCSQVIGYEFD